MPYRRGQSPTADQANLYRGFDVILEPYRAAPKAPIRSATLLVPTDLAPGDHIENARGQSLFVFAEIVAFAGLADRDYFGFNYWSRDNFRLVVQNYEQPQASTRYQTRRRDGATTVLASSHFVLIPEHISTSNRVSLDDGVLQLLATTTALPNWGPVYEALLHFNTANTDSDALTGAIELVLMVSALERLYDVTSGKCQPLIEYADSLLGSAPRVAKGASRRVPSSMWEARFGKRNTLTSVWMQDLCALRGTVAHGGSPDRYPSIWSLHEHLLFAAALFPVALRRSLGLSDRRRDRALIGAFETLLDSEPFVVLKPDGTASDFPWNQILKKVRTRQFIEDAVAHAPGMEDL